MVDNTRKINSTPINLVQEQTRTNETSSPEVKRVSNSTLVLATLGVGLAIALIVAGVVTLPLSAIAGVVCIALGIGIGVSAGAYLVREGYQCLKKTKQETALPPIELQPPARLRSDSAQVVQPQQILQPEQVAQPEQMLGIQSRELVPLDKKDTFGKSLKSQIADCIIQKNHISPALKDLVSEQLNLYTDSAKDVFYLDVAANGECFYRCALIALTRNHIYALSDPNRLLAEEVNIFASFEAMTGIKLADIFQVSLIETNSIYEDTGLSVNNPNINISPYLTLLHRPNRLHTVLFPGSILYKYSAGNLESSRDLQQSLMLLLSEMDGTYKPEAIESWLASNPYFSGNRINLVRFHADLEQVHKELQFSTTVSNSYFTLLAGQLAPEITAKMNLMASANHYLYQLSDSDIPEPEQEAAEADTDSCLETQL